MAKSRLYIANRTPTSFSISPGQTDPTCWCNIIQHCWIQNVALVWPPCFTMMHDDAWCWMMLNEVWFPSNIVCNIIQHFFFSFFLKCEENFAFVWPPCSTLLNASMPAKLTFPGICFHAQEFSLMNHVWWFMWWYNSRIWMVTNHIMIRSVPLTP